MKNTNSIVIEAMADKIRSLEASVEEYESILGDKDKTIKSLRDEASRMRDDINKLKGLKSA